MLLGLIRTIKPYFKGAPFYNAFLRRNPCTCSRIRSMRYSVRVCAALIFGSVLFLCTQASPQKRAANMTVPGQFAIGRHTFIDVGPPNDFYELFLVRSASDDISVQRFTLTPPGDRCIAPAKFERASGSIRGTPAELLGSTNPCPIPEKDLHRELKRCKTVWCLAAQTL